MNEELKKELQRFAEERAMAVEDIDIGMLEDLVKSGAEWMFNKLKETV